MCWRTCSGASEYAHLQMDTRGQGCGVERPASSGRGPVIGFPN
ncbi:hypothetical protein [Streptomyces sp. MMG1121]|nr:hypothetical protein [Streptomyces sp. MMG1121]